MRSIKVKSKISDYQVEFYDNIQSIANLTKQSIAVIDSNVYALYKDYFTDVDVITFDCVENNKTLDGSINIYRELIRRGVKSNGSLFVIGGGILQDVVGFVCSTYCRGIKYELVPTTLLSQCDSCIGGKTSINFESVKNILGTFYPPNKIHICSDFIKTLTKEDYFSGLGEIVKFNILKNTTSNLSDLKIQDLIFDSLLYKASIIEIDEFDKKERKFLNYGHTFGHALESTSNYKIPHGTAVLFGILVANNVSKIMGLLEENEELKILNLIYEKIKHQELNDSWFKFEDLIEIVKHDKKNTGHINMVLITNDGPQIVKIESQEVLKQAVKNTYEVIRLRNTIS